MLNGFIREIVSRIFTLLTLFVGIVVALLFDFEPVALALRGNFVIFSHLAEGRIDHALALLDFIENSLCLVPYLRNVLLLDLSRSTIPVSQLVWSVDTKVELGVSGTINVRIVYFLGFILKGGEFLFFKDAAFPDPIDSCFVLVFKNLNLLFKILELLGQFIPLLTIGRRGHTPFSAMTLHSRSFVHPLHRIITEN